MNELSRLGHEVSAGQIPDLDNNQSPFRGPLAGWRSLQSDQRSEPICLVVKKAYAAFLPTPAGEVNGPVARAVLDPPQLAVTVSSPPLKRENLQPWGGA